MSASILEPVSILHAQPPAPGALASLPDFAAHLLGVPLSIITPMEGRSFCTRAADDDDAWTARRDARLAQTLCRFPAASGRPLLIEDARAHPAVRAEPQLWMGEAAYLGVPIRTPDGRVLGTFCAIDAHPRRWAEGEARVLA